MGANNGTRLIDRITAGSPNERRGIHIPEWDITLYFRPLTKAELEAAIPNDGVDRSQDTASMFLLVHTCEDEQGNKVFERRDIERLRTKVPLQLVTRLEAFMYGVQRPTVAEAKAELKNGEGSFSDSKLADS